MPIAAAGSSRPDRAQEEQRRAPRTRPRARSSAARGPSRRGPCRDPGSTTARRSMRPTRRPAARRRGRASRRNGRLGPDIGGRVREPGASPGRSRRCEGRRCPTTTPLAHAGKAVEQGAPSQKTCRPSIRTPRGRRIRVSTHSHAPRGRWARARRSWAPPRPRSSRVRVEGKTEHDLRRDATARVRDHCDSTRSSPRASAASSTTTCQVTGFGPYVDQIGRNAAAGFERLGVQGQRRVAARRRRPGRGSRTATSCSGTGPSFTDAGGPPTLELTRTEAAATASWRRTTPAIPSTLRHAARGLQTCCRLQRVARLPRPSPEPRASDCLRRGEVERLP